MEPTSASQNPTPEPKGPKTVLCLPNEISFKWIEMVSSPDDLFALSRVGNAKFFYMATRQLLDTSSQARQSAFYWASMKGDVALLRLVGDLGVDVNRQFPFRDSYTPANSTIPIYRVASTPLNIAIHHQQVEIVRILLQDYNASSTTIDMQQSFNYPYAPLQRALYFKLRTPETDKQKRCDIVSLLLDHNATPISGGPLRDGSDVNPFMNAVINEAIPASLVKRLIPVCIPHHPRRGFGFDYLNEYLHYQSRRGAFPPNQLQKLELLLETVQNQGLEGAGWPKSRFLEGAIFRIAKLHVINEAAEREAAMLDQYLKLVLAKFTQPETEYGYSQSPFVTAIQFLFEDCREGIRKTPLAKWTSIAQRLLDAGIDASQCYMSDVDPVSLFTDILPFETAGEIPTKHVSTVLAFLCYPSKYSETLVYELVRFLVVEKGTPIDAQDYFGLTALHHASKYLDHDRVAQFIEYGADVNEVDNRGLTPLHFACRLDPPYMYDMRPTDPKDIHLECLSREERLVIARMLLDNEADPAATDQDGLTPLHYACKYGFLDLVQLLLACPGVDANAPANDLTRPLHLVSYHPPKDRTKPPEIIRSRSFSRDITYAIVRKDTKPKIARLLLDLGAQVKAEDGEGCLPITYARQYADPAVAEVLVQYGGDDGKGFP
ncbi:hypothetical protein Hte_007245 [Hypoxylon texense]